MKLLTQKLRNTKLFAGLVLVSTLLVSLGTSAQTYTMTSGGNISACSGTFYDPGGTGNYANNQNYTYTICSSTPGQQVQVNFSSFNIESGWDFLTINTGSGSTQYTGTNSPGVVTSTNGCLTFTFTSDGSVTAAGWIATISCVTGSGGGGGGGPTQPGGTNCSNLSPICTAQGLNFTANSGGVPASTADPGNNYDCLITQPNPSWYYLEISQAGAINMSLTAPSDIDFIVYGPYSSLAAAQADCGGYGVAPNNVVDCSFSATNMETPSIPNAQVGQVYVMLITNYANVVQNITLTQTSGTGATNCGIVYPCTITNMTANVGACNPATNTFSVSGSVSFLDEPTTGTLTIADCNGNQQVFNAPFTSPQAYNITGINANGAPCSVTATFSADPTCTETITYTNPANCQPNCFMTYISVNVGACDPNDNTFDLTGQIQFTDPPTTGTLTVTDCNGNQQVFNAPFVSPVNYTIANINSDGTTNCSVTAVFSADPLCTITTPLYDNPSGCMCSADAGTYSQGTTAGSSTNSPGPLSYDLCYGDQLNINANGDYIPPDDYTGTIAAPYTPGIWLLVYDCPPTVGPPNDINTDPCLLGVASSANGAWSIVNNLGNGSTYWYVPVTMYSMTNGTYAISINGGDWCYDLGPAYEVTFLEDIVAPVVEDCQAGTATVTVSGGLPASQGTNFTASNLQPGTASLSNTTAGNGGTFTITGLQDGDTYSLDITDGTNCSITITGTFTGVEDPTFTYPQPAYCQNAANPSPTITGVAGGSFTSSPAGLSINGSTGVVNLAASTPGTYTITYTTPDPICFDQATFVLTVNPLPIVDGNDVTVCAGGTVTLNGTGADTYTWNNGVTNGVPFPAPASTTTYTVTGTITATGCSNTGTAVVTVNPLDNASFTTTNFCQGTASPAATVTGTPGGTFSYNPNPMDGSSVNAASGSITGGVGGTTYTLQYTTSGPCPATSTQPVTVYALPVVDVPDYTVCVGGTVTLTATGATNYTWTPGTYLNTTTGASVNSTPAANIQYTVTGTDANGCVNTDVTNVTIIPNAPINAGLDVTICAGESTTLTATGGVNYNWLAPISASGASQTVSPAATTTYTVNGTDANGCAGTDQVMVTVNPLPTAAISGGGTLCINGAPAPTITFTGANGTAPYTFTYNINGGAPQTIVSTGNTATITAPVGTAGTFNYNLVSVSDASSTVCDQAQTGTATVTVNPLPIVNAGTDQTICIGAQVTLSGSGASTYTWDNGVMNNTPFSPAATTTYTVTGTDVNGCQNTDQVIVTVNPLPIVDAGLPQTICAGEQVTLSGAGASTYTWNNGVINNTPFTPAGTTTYTVTGTDVNGCQNTDQVTVTVNPLPTAVISGGGTLCINGAPAPTITFIGSNGTAPYTFTYNINGGAPQTVVSTGNTATITAPVGTAGTFNYNLVSVSDASATICDQAQTGTVTVTVNPLPIVNAGLDQTVCQGTAVTLSGSGASTYTWDNGVSNNIAFTPGVGSVTYTVTGTDANGCQNTDQVVVTVNANPVINAGLDQVVCDGVQVTLSGSGAGVGGTYSWNNGAVNGVAFTQAVGTVTYTVTGTDANGCQGTDQMNVTVNPNPTPTINGAAEYCTGQFSTLSTSQPYNGYLWSNGMTSPTVNVTAGSYTVTVTDVNGCQGTSPAFAVIENNVVTYNSSITICQGQSATIHGVPQSTAGVYSQTFTLPTGCDSTSNVTLVVNPLPAVDAGVAQTICSGEQVTLSGSGATSYIWDNGVINSVPFTPAGTTTYTITGTDANGCVNTDQVTVTVNPLPTAAISGGGTLCINGAPAPTVTFTGSNGTAPYTFTYNINGGAPQTIVSTGNTATITAPVGTAGTFNYNLVSVSDASATICDQAQSGTVTVVINPLPIVDAGLPQAICIGAQVTLSGSGASTYTWDNGVVNNTPFAPTTTTTYTVTGTDVNGCQNTDQVVVTVNPLPTVDAGAPQTICAGEQVTLSGSGASTYTWNNGVINNTAFTPAGTTTYTVTGTDVNGCQNTDQVTVTVNPLPTASISGGGTLCINGAPAPTVTFTGANGTAPYTFTYNINGGAPQTVVSAGNTATITAPVGTAGTFNYNLVSVSDASATICDQAQTGTATVVINPLPTVNAGLDQTICIGAQVTLSGSGASTYTWDNGVLNNTPFSPTTTLTYTVTGTDINGCQNTDQVVVNVNPLPTVDAGSPQAVCFGEQVTLNGSGASTYTWDNGVLNGVPFVPQGTTTYTVTGTDANGCVNTDQVIVTVNPLPTVDAGPDQTVCEGVAVTLNGSGAVNYSWTSGVQNGVSFIPPVGTTVYTVTGTDANGCQNTDQVSVTATPLPTVFAGNDFTICEGEDAILTGSGASTYVWDNGVTNGVSFTPSVGSVTYTVTGTDANGCEDTDQVTVTVEALPVVSFTADVTSGCEPLTVTLTNTSSGNITDCIWTLSNGTTLAGCGSVTITIPNGGLYDVTLTTSTANGCTSSATYEDYIYVEDNPIASFSVSSSEVSVLNTQVFTDNTSTGAVAYLWNFGDETSSSTQFEPTHTFPDQEPGTYVIELIAYSPLGCTDTAYQTIVVNEEVIFYVPNTFTPDDDDYNETFKPVFTAGYDPFDFELLIFNRWGEIIWESHDASVGWDGTYGGTNEVQDGTYVWRIEFKTTINDERVRVTGHVNVIR